MKCADFEFDGRYLSEFGLILCHFGSTGLETIDGAEITFNTVSVQNGKKHEQVSTEYENALETVFQVCKHSCTGGIEEITDVEHREIVRWLNRHKFLKLKLLDENNVDIYHEATFPSINKIEIDGKLVGLELNLITNAPFPRKEPVIISINNQRLHIWNKYNMIKDSDGNILGKGNAVSIIYSQDKEDYPIDGIRDEYYYIYAGEGFKKHSIFDTSHEEGYIYPYTEITILEDGDLTIHNALEDRDTNIVGCVTGEVITMKYPIIQTSEESHEIQDDFNWNFFRVANTFENRRNDLTISIPCTIKIEYSPIVKVGL